MGGNAGIYFLRLSRYYFDESVQRCAMMNNKDKANSISDDNISRSPSQSFARAALPLLTPKPQASRRGGTCPQQLERVIAASFWLGRYLLAHHLSLSSLACQSIEG